MTTSSPESVLIRAICDTMRRKKLESQGKEIVAKVYERMRFEALNGVSNLTDPIWRTAEACGISRVTVRRVRKQEKQAIKAGNPDDAFNESKKDKLKKFKSKSGLDDIDVGLLRHTILSYLAEPNHTPSLRRLKEVLANKLKYDGSFGSIGPLLKEAGFEWTDGPGKRMLLEKHEMKMSKFNYLKQLKQYKEEGRHLVFTHESFLNIKSDTRKKNNARIIIINAGSHEGFVPNASYIFRPQYCGGDFRDKITFGTYKTWFTNQLLPNLPENSVIIIDNAHYHNFQSEKPPNAENSKESMRTWLTKNNIKFDESLTKVELYDLILKNQDKFANYEIDKLARAKGFEILRLPPQHPELNPLKKIWDIIKEEVTDKSTSANVVANIELVKEEIKNIPPKTWAGVCRAVEYTEKYYEKYLDSDRDAPMFDEYESDGEGIEIKDEDMSRSSDDEMSE